MQGGGRRRRCSGSGARQDLIGGTSHSVSVGFARHRCCSSGTSLKESDWSPPKRGPFSASYRAAADEGKRRKREREREVGKRKRERGSWEEERGREEHLICIGNNNKQWNGMWMSKKIKIILIIYGKIKICQEFHYFRHN